MEYEIISYFRSACLLRTISYSASRLSVAETIRILPEIAVVQRYFHPNCIEMWNKEMLLHNTLLNSGLKMGLSNIDSLDRLKFNSLDLFLIRMRGHILVEVLDAFSTFAERFSEAVSSNQDALLWCVRWPVIITRDRWISLCWQLASVLKLLDCNGVSDEYPWPDLKSIENSTRRARTLFTQFAIPEELKSLVVAFPASHTVDVTEKSQGQRGGDRKRSRRRIAST